jgi:GGDEF domain-containing protein
MQDRRYCDTESESADEGYAASETLLIAIADQLSEAEAPRVVVGHVAPGEFIALLSPTRERIGSREIDSSDIAELANSALPQGSNVALAWSEAAFSG